MPLPSKIALRDELIEHLLANLANLERAHQSAIEGATHEEAKPENDKDTRGLEQSYLARGQAKRVEEMRTSLLELQAMPLSPFGKDQEIALGALITVEENDVRRVLFLAPYGGGTTLAHGAVQVVIPRSPLGEALLGKYAGEDCEVPLGGRTRELSILRVD